MTGFPLLSALIFIPALGALGTLVLRRHPEGCRRFALGVTLLDFVLALTLLSTEFHRGAGDWFFLEDHAWIDRFGIRFALGIDGVSLVLVLLTTFLAVICVLVSWRQIRERTGLFHFFLLLIQSGVLGVFLATDLFVFYLFWELQVIPMFFLIGMWGHEGRVRATIKFVLYSIGGSLLMLAALIVLYLVHGSETGQYTFSLFELQRTTTLSPGVEFWLFLAFVLAFAVKVPLIPVHAWLPDAHTEAPTAGSVVLAGLLLKTGAYALLRFAFPLFPGAASEAAPVLAALAVGGLFYAAWIAFAQRDVKRLVAYSSIAHMGLIVAGFAVWNAMTVSGAVLQMVNHGITTSALFIMVGMLDERVGSRDFAAFGGLWKRMPVFSAFFLLFCMSSLGLPGLNNFVGEILILVGSFKKWTAAGVAGFAGLALVLIYTLRLVQDVLFGAIREDARFTDLSLREAVVLVPLALLVVAIGLVPGPLLKLIQGPIHGLLAPVVRVAGK